MGTSASFAPAAQEQVQKPQQEQQKPKKSASAAIAYPFWFGGSASSMAACVTHPLDLLKVRLQTRTGNAPRTMSGTLLHILRNDGVVGLYSGISASLLRQMTYSTVRFGVYDELKLRLARAEAEANGGKAKEPSLPVLVALATGSGMVGGVAGNFADVLNVRMQHDAALPPAQRREYRHAIDGLVRMTREEGPRALFRGWLPNSTRAAFMTAGQLASYDVAKRFLLEYTPLGDTLTTHFTASFFAGFVAATVTSPVDVVKTRIMSSAHGHGVLHHISDLTKTDGVRWMFKGWVPSFLRLAPQTICTFVFLEMHRKVYRQVKGLEPANL